MLRVVMTIDIGQHLHGHAEVARGVPDIHAVLHAPGDASVAQDMRDNIHTKATVGNQTGQCLGDILNRPAVELDRESQAIRFGTLQSSGLVARRLGTIRRILVASPGYLRKHGTPDTPAALATHRQVRFSWAATDAGMPLVGPGGSLLVPVRTGFLANNTFVLTKALVAGRGLGGAQLPQIDAELADGSLVQIMPDYEYAPLEVHAVVPTSQFVPAKVRAFMDYLKTAVGKII